MMKLRLASLSLVIGTLALTGIACSPIDSETPQGEIQPNESLEEPPVIDEGAPTSEEFPGTTQEGVVEDGAVAPEGFPETTEDGMPATTEDMPETTEEGVTTEDMPLETEEEAESTPTETE